MKRNSETQPSLPILSLINQWFDIRGSDFLEIDFETLEKEIGDDTDETIPLKEKFGFCKNYARPQVFNSGFFFIHCEFLFFHFVIR